MLEMKCFGTSLVVQWLRTPNAGDLSLIPGQRTRSHMVQLRLSATKEIKIENTFFKNKLIFSKTVHVRDKFCRVQFLGTGISNDNQRGETGMSIE